MGLKIGKVMQSYLCVACDLCDACERGAEFCNVGTEFSAEDREIFIALARQKGWYMRFGDHHKAEPSIALCPKCAREVALEYLNSGPPRDPQAQADALFGSIDKGHETGTRLQTSSVMTNSLDQPPQSDMPTVVTATGVVKVEDD